MTLEELRRLDDDGRAAERLRCKTDLFYLAVEYLGYDLVQDVHGPVCDFFVHKFPDKPIEEWDTVKDRLLLDPREHYKTTIDVADIIQAIICFPDIRIAVFSGTEDLTTEIMQMVQRHFQINEKFKFLFFEHAIGESVRLPVFKFNTPARTDWRLREATVTAATILSGTTGGHYNVIKFDDIVTPQNSETKDQLEKTRERVKQIIPLVVVGGYRDFIGTRYDHSDAYGGIIDKLEGDKVVMQIPFGSITSAATWKVFERKACSLPFNEQSEILFKENGAGKKAFDYGELRKRLHEMEHRLFGCQYLNDPIWGEASSFKKEMLEGLMIPMQAIPLIVTSPLSGQQYKGCKVFTTWDLAFSVKKQACRTVGAVGAFDAKGRLFLIDLEVGKFSADEFIYKFLLMYRKWLPFMGRVGIEEAAGSPLIMPGLRAYAMNLKMPLSIDWLPVSPMRSKEERVFGLLPLMKTGKFFIRKDIPFLEDLMREFTRFPKGKVDIPDAVSRLLHYQNVVDLSIPFAPQETIFESRKDYDSPLGYGFVA